jgi:hypothetical protein
MDLWDCGLQDINDSTPSQLASPAVGCRLVDHAGLSEQLHAELTRSREIHRTQSLSVTCRVTLRQNN